MTIQRWSWWGTGVFGVVAISAAIRPRQLASLALGVDALLMAIGCAAFAVAYLGAIRRSRTDAIGIGGLFFLAGDCAPAPVRRSLLAALSAQVVLALATAGVRPHTNLAAGVLVPVFGIAMCGLWATRHGKFDPRQS